ncbi:MAG: methyl-accepting chemotaxis protein, partial [Candidatus Acidiferrales bacterium]
VLSYQKTAEVERKESYILNVCFPTINNLTNWERDLSHTQENGRQFVLAATQQYKREKAQKTVDEAWDSVARDTAALDTLAPQWPDQSNRDALLSAKDVLKQIRVNQQKIMAGIASGEREALLNGGDDFDRESTTLVVPLNAALRNLSAVFNAQLKDNQASLALTQHAMMETLAVTTLMALCIGIFVAAFLSRAISRATAEVLSQAESIAAGDLTREDLVFSSQDELGLLAAAINKMKASLREIVSSIAVNSHQVARASEEFSGTSQQISANSEETSAQVNTVTSATDQISQNLATVATGAEEMSATIKEIAKSAGEAARVAGEAVRIAETTNITIAKLGESSAQIGQVIKVITSIAQQTNLLALNATIEAA